MAVSRYENISQWNVYAKKLALFCSDFDAM